MNSEISKVLNFDRKSNFVLDFLKLHFSKCRITEKLIRILASFGQGSVSSIQNQVNAFLLRQGISYQLTVGEKSPRQEGIWDEINEELVVDTKNSIRGDQVTGLLDNIEDLLNVIFASEVGDQNSGAHTNHYEQIHTFQNLSLILQRWDSLAILERAPKNF